ncbi:hypothetical protein [Microcoleus anatoxicus]|uniref:Transposase n=1 Tax=Microcoleus anatoxicus PTRS2 TaxID=2705321 RepID=A0ABU8YSB4_9CYAN
MKDLYFDYNECRSLLMRYGRSVIRNNKGRSQFVQSLQCLVFGVKGDRRIPSSTPIASLSFG